MGLIVKNLAAVMANLARTESKVHKGSLKALRDSAEVIVKAAKANAPVDDGHLVACIVASEIRERTALGRFGQITVNVGVDASKLASDSGIAYDYSVPMHEEEYNLGPKSEQKQASSPGVVVGSKFLERAFADKEREVRALMEAALRASVTK